MAALVGVMMMVAIGTFEWASFRVIDKMPRHDIFIGITVAVITVLLHNLALAVLVGVVLSALVFAWDNAKRIRVTSVIDTNNIKKYAVNGPLFFGSIAGFIESFDVANDPDEVVIDFKDSRVADMSAIDALSNLTQKYSTSGKTIRLKHLSKDCIKLLKNAEGIIEVNIVEDPTYKVAASK